MNKNVGLTYVDEFSFPKEQGFSGSASPSEHKVKGYMRGGHVKKMGEGGKFGKPGDKYPPNKARQTMPKNVKAHGGSVHDKLIHEGAKMGYAYGGQVKPSNTSAQFKQTRAKQDTMDHGNQPARRGRNQAEIEAGGTKRLKPGLKQGGYMKGGVHRVRDSGGSRLADQALRTSKKVLRTKHKMKPPERVRAASRAGMPKTVKAHGGLAQYAQGGVAKKAGAAQ